MVEELQRAAASACAGQHLVKLGRAEAAGAILLASPLQGGDRPIGAISLLLFLGAAAAEQMHTREIWVTPIASTGNGPIGGIALLFSNPVQGGEALRTDIEPVVAAVADTLDAFRQGSTVETHGQKRLDRKAKGLIGLTLAVAIAGLLALPTDHRIKAPSLLEPEVRRFVVAPFAGVLETSRFKPGDRVEQGDILATLDVRELDPELLLEDPITLRFYRIGRREHAFMVRLDGKRSPGAALADANLSLTAPLTEEEAAEILRFLYREGLLRTRGRLSQQRLESVKRNRLFGNRLRKLDLAGAAWLALKLLHELLHGLVSKRYGGQVYEAGVVLVLFMPIGYVDATPSWRFPNRWQRIHTAAAGMIAELTAAGIAAGELFYGLGVVIALLGGARTRRRTPVAFGNPDVPGKERILARRLPDLAGIHVKTGFELMSVVDEGRKAIRMSVAAADLPLLTLSLGDRRSGRMFHGKLRQTTPRATTRVEIPMFAVTNGGPLPVRPKASAETDSVTQDGEHFEYLEPRVILETSLDDADSLALYAGEVGVARLPTAPRTLGDHALTALQDWLEHMLERRDDTL